MEKPNDETNIQMLNNESNNMNHILGQETNDYRNTIYGLFYRLSFGTLAINENHGEKKKTGFLPKIQGFLPLLFGIPLLIRAGFLLSQLSKTTLLTKNWALTFSLAITSIHGFLALVILIAWNSKNFFNDFAHRLHLFLKTRDKQIDSKPYKKVHILAFLFLIFYVYAFVYFGVENYLFYDQHASTPNSTAFFREPLAGSIALWPIDFVIIVFSSFVSAILLIYYLLINHALVVETQQFNAELKEAAENGQLKHVDLLNNYNNRHLELLNIIRFTNEKLNMVTTPNLMFFIICHFSNIFIMRGFDTELETHQKFLSINLILASAFALLITIKRPASLNKEVHETKTMLLLQKSIWNDIDVKTSVIVNSIIDRVIKADFFAVIFDGFVINESLFHIVFFIFPIVVEILACWKKFMV